MNFLDVLIILPILYGAWLGFKKGFVIEICTLLALVLGVWGGIHFSDFVSDAIESAFSSTFKYLPVVAFALTFMLVAGAVYFMGKVIEKSINLIALKPLNKFAGLAFGTLKYLFVVAVVLVLLESFNKRSEIFDKATTSSSVFYHPVKMVALETLPALEYSDLLFDCASQAKEGLNLLPSDTSGLSETLDIMSVFNNMGN